MCNILTVQYSYSKSLVMLSPLYFYFALSTPRVLLTSCNNIYFHLIFKAFKLIVLVVIGTYLWIFNIIYSVIFPLDVTLETKRYLLIIGSFR